MNDEMIVIKQLPIIEQQLKVVSEEIDEKVKDAIALVCSEENVKFIKEVRATLNKELKEYEDKRKQVKAEVMKPYEEFEASYKVYISDKYKRADVDLKNKIDAVEDELKRKKQIELLDYFNEYARQNNIDFVTIKRTNINVTLSASMKSLKEQAKNFIDKIVDDLKLIDIQEHRAEILVEYERSLNVSDAITTVTNRFKAIEKAKQKEHVPTIEEVEQIEFKPNKEFKIIPTKKEFKITFNLADGELENIISFLEKKGIEYKMEGI